MQPRMRFWIGPLGLCFMGVIVLALLKWGLPQTPMAVAVQRPTSWVAGVMLLAGAGWGAVQCLTYWAWANGKAEACNHCEGPLDCFSRRCGACGRLERKSW